MSGTLAARAVASGAGIESWDVIDALAGLVGKSMVNIDDCAGGEARYRMLEMIREFALERLEASGEAEQVLARHAEVGRRLGTWLSQPENARTAGGAAADALHGAFEVIDDREVGGAVEQLVDAWRLHRPGRTATVLRPAIAAQQHYREAARLAREGK